MTEVGTAQRLLEREHELDLLTGLLNNAGSAGGRVVLIRGEAGIGKTGLVKEIIDRHQNEAHVYFGFCDDLLTPQPLGPFWDIAREESSLGGALEKGDRRAVMGVLLDLLSRSLRPTFLVVEDTHWADEATLDVIKYLGRRIGGTNGLLVLTYRDGEVDYDHPLRLVIGELAPQDLVRIHLGGLSAEAVASMIDDTGLDPDEVLAVTDGNPLFVTAVAASGVEGVPSSVQDSVLARARKLSSGARRLLDLVSVIPGESERSLIEIIVQPTEEQIAECVRQGLLGVADDTVFFNHELTRRAVESALGADDRRRLNQEVLAELGGTADLSRLVHHARGADDVKGIIEFAPRAASEAMAVASHREALAYFQTLAPYLDHFADENRADILEDWARSLNYLNDAETLDISARAIELRRSIGDDHALARTLTFAARVNGMWGQTEAAEACAVEAVAILESHSMSADLAFAVARLAWLLMMKGDHKRAIELADRALRLGEETSDEATIIHALHVKGTSTYSRGDPDGLRLLDQARSRAEQGGYPFEETVALINMASVAVAVREFEKAGPFAERARHTAAQYEIPNMEDYALSIHAESLFWKGEWIAAEDFADKRLGLPGAVLGRLQSRQGRPEAQDTLDRTWSQAQTGQMQHLLPAAAAQAEFMWLIGHHDPELTARFREVLDEGLRLEWSWEAGDLAFWLWELDELLGAPEGIAEPYRLVMAGRPAEASAIWETKGIPYERALALMHGDEKSRLEALEILETLGATPVAAKLRQTLRDQGVSVPRRSPKTRGSGVGLTARQAEVLQLLEEELSNIEIADRLFLSPRTVEHHVAAVMSKLNASTRDQAVASAAEQGLLTSH